MNAVLTLPLLARGAARPLPQLLVVRMSADFSLPLPARAAARPLPQTLEAI